MLPRPRAQHYSIALAAAAVLRLSTPAAAAALAPPGRGHVLTSEWGSCDRVTCTRTRLVMCANQSGARISSRLCGGRLPPSEEACSDCAARTEAPAEQQQAVQEVQEQEKEGESPPSTLVPDQVQHVEDELQQQQQQQQRSMQHEKSRAAEDITAANAPAQGRRRESAARSQEGSDLQLREQQQDQQQQQQQGSVAGAEMDLAQTSPGAVGVRIHARPVPATPSWTVAAIMYLAVGTFLCALVMVLRQFQRDNRRSRSRPLGPLYSPLAESRSQGSAAFSFDPIVNPFGRHRRVERLAEARFPGYKESEMAAFKL
eukprot:TRINITY_DN73_c2_g1_i1.p1 TRINITY_DN73_c2_g1~~TRINITY_DN73_c2_g1_i1.p1  ORF type:complete len:315 (-),score=63.65 TRINITY_DN73_c2_g1_i1:13-957(-)